MEWLIHKFVLFFGLDAYTQSKVKGINAAGKVFATRHADELYELSKTGADYPDTRMVKIIGVDRE